MTSSTTAQSLLALPSGITDPSPYAVFGLRSGEADAARIGQAVKATVARLNASKATADAAAWQQAVSWVKRSREILLDPARKAQLDAGISGESTAATSNKAAANELSGSSSTGDVDDPLAGLLPGASGPTTNVARTPAPPFRAGPAHLPAAHRSSGPAVSPPDVSAPVDHAAAVGGPAVLATTATHSPVEELQAVAAAIAPIQVVDQQAKRSQRRRKQFPWTTLVLAFLSGSAAAAIGGLLYLLTQHPHGISMHSPPASSGAGNRMSVAAVPASDADETGLSGNRRQPRDPVMGRLGGAQNSARRDTATGGNATRDAAANPANSGRSPERLAAADDWLTRLPPASDEPAADDDADGESSMTASRTTTMPVGAMASPPDATEPATAATGALPTVGTAMTAGEKDAAAAAIAKAREAIAKADWDTMLQQAEAAQQAAATAEDKVQASRLVQLADLASYYHGGIEKGLDGLGAGESFNVTEQLQIVVVEIGPEKVIFRFSGRNKEYPRRELPLVLAHRIARFAVATAEPVGIAAANAYQAIAPISTQQYREQAIAALEAMEEPVEGADPADVAAAIRDVFGE
jgi:hypothetical protein